MIAIFTSLLFVGAFFAALATITGMMEIYAGRAIAALNMEHRPINSSVSETAYAPMRPVRTIRVVSTPLRGQANIAHRVA